MKPRERLLNPVILLAWVLAALMLFIATNGEATTSSDLYQKIRLFSEVLKSVQDQYVSSVDGDSLIDGAIQGMLDCLDPHTAYFPPVAANSFLSEMQGEYGGFGVTIDQVADGMQVNDIVPGYAAEKAGILPGDCLIAVDGVSIAGMPFEQAAGIIRGPVGTHASVSVRRPGVETELVFNLERQLIVVNNIPYAFKMDNGVGYIRVREFVQNIDEQFRTQLESLEQQGIRGLIVDMRYNPGGSLDEAVDMVNEFIGGDKLVVSSRGRSPSANQEYYTKYNRIHSGYPIIVLVNRYSASAAEIFAGSLQDYDVALVMGETSFGKGSVQTILPLSSGMLKITIARYYLNSGRCIHREENDILLRGREVSESDRLKFEKQRKTDLHYTQRGRVVYGGGGITPDIDVESMRLTSLGMDLRRENLIGEFAREYASRNDIGKDFRIDDSLRKSFLAFVASKGIIYTPEVLDSTRNYLDISLRASIITIKNGDLEGYKAQIPIDLQLSEAISMFDRFPDLNAMFEYANSLKREK